MAMWQAYLRDAYGFFLAMGHGLYRQAHSQLARWVEGGGRSAEFGVRSIILLMHVNVFGAICTDMCNLIFALQLLSEIFKSFINLTTLG